MDPDQTRLQSLQLQELVVHVTMVNDYDCSVQCAMYSTRVHDVQYVKNIICHLSCVEVLVDVVHIPRSGSSVAVLKHFATMRAIDDDNDVSLDHEPCAWEDPCSLPQIQTECRVLPIIALGKGVLSWILDMHHCVYILIVLIFHLG